MRNRITDYLPKAWRPRTPDQPPPAGSESFDLRQLVQPVERFVGQHPAAALAAAFAIGVAVAWWIKRR